MSVPFDADLIAKLMKTCPAGENVADYISVQLNQMYLVQRAIIAVREAHRIEKKRHAEAMEKISKQLAEVRRTCGHLQVKHHGDASGNGDSWNECEVCGAEL